MNTGRWIVLSMKKGQVHYKCPDCSMEYAGFGVKPFCAECGFDAKINHPHVRPYKDTYTHSLERLKETRWKTVHTHTDGSAFLECPDCQGRVFKDPYLWSIGENGVRHCPYCGSDLLKK